MMNNSGTNGLMFTLFSYIYMSYVYKYEKLVFKISNELFRKALNIDFNSGDDHTRRLKVNTSKVKKLNSDCSTE